LVIAPPASVSPNRASSPDAAPPTERYVRQTLFAPIGPEGQRRIGATRVLLVGSGALGGAVADLLVRAGIGRLILADRDYVELGNLQRQTLFDEADVAEHLPKAAAASARLRRINGDVRIEPVVADVNATNIERLASDVDLIVDGTDNFETRYLINDVAVKRGLPWVYGGVIGSYGMTMTIRPGETPCLRCVFPEPPPAGSAPTCDTAGVLGPAVGMVAALQVAEALKLAVGDVEAMNTDLLAIDVWRLSLDRIPLPAPRPDCPTCGRRDFAFLVEISPSRTTVLCGHDAVHVRVHPSVTLDLAALSARLGAIGDVRSNRYLLRFRESAGAHELTVFADGRAIVKGTTDPTEARVLYARYVGA